ncbi:hypothetical protein BGX38DRAFT_1266385 [Terfezia claveryi]|nr:hypothetical protein BGX38DRAFT_1266385 [Terfezia claveryi]
MEPNCAICNGPAYRQCPCEHQSLIVAVEQSEQRALHPMWNEIRYWVTTQAKAEIHRDFQARSSYRRAQHSAFLSQNTGRLTNEMLDRVNLDLQRGIDDDWRVAVQRYPEVLDYFYAMVAWTVRADSISSSTGVPMVSPSCESHADGYFTMRSRPMSNPHSQGPLPPSMDSKQQPARPFYCRNNSYGSIYSASSSGYASGSGSLPPLSSSASGVEARQQLPPAPNFQSYAYGRPVFRP